MRLQAIEKLQTCANGGYAREVSAQNEALLGLGFWGGVPPFRTILIPAPPWLRHLPHQFVKGQQDIYVHHGSSYGLQQAAAGELGCAMLHFLWMHIQVTDQCR